MSLMTTWSEFIQRRFSTRNEFQMKGPKLNNYTVITDADCTRLFQISAIIRGPKKQLMPVLGWMRFMSNIYRAVYKNKSGNLKLKSIQLNCAARIRFAFKSRNFTSFVRQKQDARSRYWRAVTFYTSMSVWNVRIQLRWSIIKVKTGENSRHCYYCWCRLLTVFSSTNKIMAEEILVCPVK